MFGAAFASGAKFACGFRMARSRTRSAADALRAEARLLTIAGLLLFAGGFPITLILAAGALAGTVAPPLLPAVVGAPPLMLGYLACHFASQRLVKAKALDGRRRSSAKRSQQPRARSANRSTVLTW